MSQENKPSKFTLELPLSKAVENAQARNLIRGMTIGSNSVNQKIFRKLQQQFSPKIFKQCVFHAGRAGYLSWLDADEISNESWGSLFVSPTTYAPKQEMLIAYLAARFETHSKTLNEFIRELRILDNSIAHQDDKALGILISMVLKYGWSIVLMSRLALLHTSAENNQDVGRYVSEQLELPANRGYAAYYFSFYDIFDFSEPYGVYELRVQGVLNDESRFSGEATLAWVKTIYHPLKYFRDDFLRTLFNFQKTSLIDSLYLVFLNFETGCLSTADQKSLRYVHDLRELYYNKIDNDNKRSPQKPDKVYRLSGWFCPSKMVANWRAELDRVKGYREKQCLNKNDTTLDNYVSNYFPSGMHISKIAYESSLTDFSFEAYEPGVQFLFLRTFALFHCLLGNFNLQDLDKEQAKKVLSYTENVALGLSKNEISLFYESSKDSHELVVSFLALCLLFDKEPNSDVEFAMRMQFQETVQEWFKGDVIELLRWLSKQNPSLAHYVFRLCSTDFVDKLYLLVPTFEAGLELKEKTLRWAASEMNVDGADRLADQISKERSIRKTRGERDDSRIFVDETWFNGWIAQNVGSDLSRYTRSLQGAQLDEISETNVIVDGVQSTSLRTLGGGQQYLLLQALGRSYSEFCLHKVYGIRSYLGRRILHGTLKGHLLKPISELISDVATDPKYAGDDFVIRLEEWLKSYALLVDTMQKKRLRINSEEHPDGLINANPMSSAKKVTIFQKFTNVMVDVVRQGGTASDIASVIPDWCWALLQVDLTTIQSRYLPEIRTQAMRSLAHQFPDILILPKLQRAHVNKLMNTIEGQHRSFSTWFRRPETKLMSASIGSLVDAILTVLKKANRSFTPELEIEAGDITIHGQLYHWIYDILEILIGNVEAYGKNDGQLKIARKISRNDGQSFLIIEVFSEYDPKKDRDVLRKGIHEAMTNDDLDSVTDQTAKTGIRRIRRILKHIPESNFEFIDNEQPAFKVTVPMLET